LQVIDVRPSRPEHSRTHLQLHLARASAVVLLALAPAACGEDSDEPSAAPSAPAPAKAVYQLARLDITDRIAPERWLASRQAGRDLAEDDPEVVALKAALDGAGRRFREYPRMIANRAVQLEDMLKQKDILEPAPQLIARLSQAVGEARNVESFGALCQQYYNLRLQGLDQQEALKVLGNDGNAKN
jgi:hypothetical protein